MGDMILDSYIMILWINAVITMGLRAPFTAKDCQDLGMDKLSLALFYVRCNYSSVSQLQSLISHVEAITNVLHFTHTGKKTYFWYVQWLYFAISILLWNGTNVPRPFSQRLYGLPINIYQGFFSVTLRPVPRLRYLYFKTNLWSVELALVKFYHRWRFVRIICKI